MSPRGRRPFACKTSISRRPWHARPQYSVTLSGFRRRRRSDDIDSRSGTAGPSARRRTVPNQRTGPLGRDQADDPGPHGNANDVRREPSKGTTRPASATSARREQTTSCTEHAADGKTRGRRKPPATSQLRQGNARAAQAARDQTGRARKRAGGASRPRPVNTRRPGEAGSGRGAEPGTEANGVRRECPGGRKVAGGFRPPRVFPPGFDWSRGACAPRASPCPPRRPSRSARSRGLAAGSPARPPPPLSSGPRRL